MSSSSNRSKTKSHTSKPKTKPQNQSITILVKSEKHDSDNDNIDNVNDSISSTKLAMPPIMSRFKSFPVDVKLHPDNKNNNDNSKCSSRLRESYSSEAKSVRNKLISSLTSKEKEANEVEFMIDIANSTFALLNLMHADDRELYNVVRVYIITRCIHSEAKKECRDAFARMVRANFDLRCAELDLRDARAEVTVLQEKLAKANEIVNALSAKADELRMDYKALDAELDDLEETIGFVQKNLILIGSGKTPLLALRWNYDNDD